jgi:predicted ATPase/DNA-binding CsgD family transcriptional regulator
MGDGSVGDSTVQHTPAPANNLPLQISSFVGRERELAEVEKLLAHRRVLTLTGPGGAGKTRLALAVAADVLDEYEDGVWLAEFAPLSDPDLVAQVVASALGVREQPARSLTRTLSDEIGSRNMLLILDNCEHVIEACAGLAEALLRSCEGLGILATSREALGIAGEGIWPVPPLALPDPRRFSEVGVLSQYESVCLFADRATAVDPAFTITERNAGAVAQICYRLDGSPLAIEFAAARTKVLSVEQIAGRLDDRFALLTGGGRTALARQRTLRATMDWSHELLAQAERVTFRRLSVFAGGFTLEAAETVCAVGSGEDFEKGEVLDLLSRLVDKSLVLAREQVGEARYRLLETVRQYGEEKLEESGEAEEARKQHSRFFLALAEEAERELKGRRQVVYLERLETEHGNLRVALRRSLYGGDAELGLRLAGALGTFWRMRGHLSEGRRWLERALAEGGASEASVRAKALNRAGSMAVIQGDHAQATALLEESLGLFKDLGDKAGVAASLSDLGHAMLHRQADKGRLWELREEAEALRQEPLDRPATAHLVSFLALAASDEGDYERAEALTEEGLILHRELGNIRGVVMHLTRLGTLALLRDDHARAAALLEEDLRLSWELGDEINLVFSLLGSAGVAASRGQPARAARLWGAVDAMGESSGVVAVSPMFRSRRHYGYEDRLAAARAQLDKGAWEAAWEEGQAMTLEQAVEYALESQEPSYPPPRPGGLSNREVDVLRLVARGMTSAQVAEELFISPNTVNKHLNSIYHKLDIGSRAAATRFASEHDLL